jgi:predicted nucleic acid-binding Zn ribbon protein
MDIDESDHECFLCGAPMPGGYGGLDGYCSESCQEEALRDDD